MSSPTVEEQLAVLLGDYLARQRYFAGEVPPHTVEVVDRAQVGSVLWLLVRVPGDEAAYQVPVGLRPLEQMEDWLQGKGRWLIGDLDADDVPMLAYDAMIDQSLAPTLLAQAAPDAFAGEPEPSVRPLTVEQSNTSVIIGEQVVLKLFRRVHDGPNPDAELMGALDRVGFDAIPRQLGVWQRNGRDLAVARSFLRGGADGWLLALTSLRDLYGSREAPADAGGDFGPSAARLGSLVARMHLALAEALGTSTPQPATWAIDLAADLVELDGFHGVVGPEMLSALRDRYEHLAVAGATAPAIRIHGDLHLGQLLRNDDGWFVLDFEGEPRLSLERRRRPSSPLQDVAGMLRSFHYAAEVALLERHEEPDDELAALALAWEDHCATTFLASYLNEPGIDALLPPDDGDLFAVLGAFEAGKAVYEVGYERAHRPDWTRIPLRALRRLLQ